LKRGYVHIGFYEHEPRTPTNPTFEGVSSKPGGHEYTHPSVLHTLNAEFRGAITTLTCLPMCIHHPNPLGLSPGGGREGQLSPAACPLHPNHPVLG